MAQADDDDYGILTLLVQLDFAPREWFKIPPDCFFPSPDVDSACVILERRATPLLPENLRASFVKIVKRALLATAQDDAEIVETGLGGGQTGSRLCRIKNLAAGTRGKIELGTIRGVDANNQRLTMKQKKIKTFVGQKGWLFCNTCRNRTHHTCKLEQFPTSSSVRFEPDIIDPDGTKYFGIAHFYRLWTCDGCEDALLEECWDGCKTVGPKGDSSLWYPNEVAWHPDRTEQTVPVRNFDKPSEACSKCLLRNCFCPSWFIVFTLRHGVEMFD